ncbi:MAG: hypothetical protein IKO21_04675 [Fibrobacter sp.]|nr:hypothetical protein [Fibrobacter sp.]
MMKKYFFVIMLSISNTFAITQGRLLNFKFATYAIDNYQNNWQSPLTCSVQIADSLRLAVNLSIVAMNLAHGYYQIGATPTTVSFNYYVDTGVRLVNFLSQNAKNYNFIFYRGHGAPDEITLWNTNAVIANTTSGNGVGNTYWLWLSACSVFRNGYSDQDPWFDGVFKGVHSILGFSSISFGNIHVIWAYEDFATRWFSGNEKIWDAYYISIMNIIHTQGGYDIEPKIVYRYGYINGNFFDPWEEKFLNAYLGPVFYNNDYDGIGSRWITLGTPTY